MSVYWVSSTTCNICGRDATQYDHFIDGKTVHGPWALMCLECFQEHGIGLGLGIGQKYDSKTLEKIED